MNSIPKERARNNFPVWHPGFSPSSSVLQLQKLETERLFLHFFLYFCSIRTNEYAPNPDAKQGSYYVQVSEKVCRDIYR